MLPKLLPNYFMCFLNNLRRQRFVALESFISLMKTWRKIRIEAIENSIWQISRINEHWKQIVSKLSQIAAISVMFRSSQPAYTVQVINLSFPFDITLFVFVESSQLLLLLLILLPFRSPAATTVWWVGDEVTSEVIWWSHLLWELSDADDDTNVVRSW